MSENSLIDSTHRPIAELQAPDFRRVIQVDADIEIVLRDQLAGSRERLAGAEHDGG